MEKDEHDPEEEHDLELEENTKDDKLVDDDNKTKRRTNWSTQKRMMSC